jgi:cation:H+ antiporter
VFSDVAYRPGSIYHAITPQDQFLTVLGMVLTAIIVLGMLSRQKRGIGRIGYESVLALIVYAAGVVVVAVSG